MGFTFKVLKGAKVMKTELKHLQVSKRRESGFTMIEMLITFIVLGVLSAIAIPAFNTWLPNYRLTSSTRDIASAMQLAKLAAVKNGAQANILFDINNDSYTVFVDDGAGGGVAENNTQDGSERTVIQGTTESGIDIINATIFQNWNNQTYFDGRGLASGGFGSVVLQNSKNRYQRVVVWLAGGLEIQTSNDGVTWS